MAEQLLLGGHGLTTRTSAQVEAELRERLRGHCGSIWSTERWATDVAAWACPGAVPERRCRRPPHCQLLGCLQHPKRQGAPWAIAVRRETP